MARDINLYDPRFLRQREWLSATPLAAATGLLLLGVVALGAFSRYQADRDAEATQTLAAQVTQVQAQVSAMQALAGRADPALEAERSQWQTLVAERRQLVAALRADRSVSREGFAPYLEALARDTLPNVWITALLVGRGGEDMEIHGRALDANDIPIYLRRLEADATFHGRSFATLEARRFEEKLPEPAAGGSTAKAKPGDAPADKASPAMRRAYEFALRSRLPAEGASSRPGGAR